LILKANQIDLTVSGIEGNAILFYKIGEPPDLMAAYEQVEKMFLAFHKHLQWYENKSTCHCNACISVIDLILKTITQYGKIQRI
jgi:hypothetical protein